MNGTKETATETVQLVQFIYTSIAVTPFSRQQLSDLLTKSRQNNLAQGVSGLLVYNDGFFIQVLEGPEKVVEALYAHIGQDRRHKSLRLLLSQTITEKEYGDWSMGFVDVTELATDIEGYVPYSALRHTALDGKRARKLVRMFQDGQWRQK